LISRPEWSKQNRWELRTKLDLDSYIGPSSGLTLHLLHYLVKPVYFLLFLVITSKVTIKPFMALFLAIAYDILVEKANLRQMEGNRMSGKTYRHDQRTLRAGAHYLARENDLNSIGQV
jgi:hypothetical protein